jgi:hypothetical protein
MYSVIHHNTPLSLSYPPGRFENNIQLNVLITNDIKYLSFIDNYVGDIRLIKYIIVLHITAIPDAANKLNIYSINYECLRS